MFRQHFAHIYSKSVEICCDRVVLHIRCVCMALGLCVGECVCVCGCYAVMSSSQLELPLNAPLHVHFNATNSKMRARSYTHLGKVAGARAAHTFTRSCSLLILPLPFLRFIFFSFEHLLISLFDCVYFNGLFCFFSLSCYFCCCIKSTIVHLLHTKAFSFQPK